MLLTQDTPPLDRPRWIDLGPITYDEPKLIEALAEMYEPDSGDSVVEYCQTRGLEPHQERMLKDAIKKLRRK